MEEKDENLKNAELSAKMAVLQNTIREYQDKIKELGNKLYTCKYKGVEIKMTGNYTVTSIIIDQNTYETSSKSNLEQIIMVAFTNLKKAIVDEQEFLSNELKDLVEKSGADLPFKL